MLFVVEDAGMLFFVLIVSALGESLCGFVGDLRGGCKEGVVLGVGDFWVLLWGWMWMGRGGLPIVRAALIGDGSGVGAALGQVFVFHFPGVV